VLRLGRQRGPLSEEQAVTDNARTAVSGSATDNCDRGTPPCSSSRVARAREVPIPTADARGRVASRTGSDFGELSCVFCTGSPWLLAIAACVAGASGCGAPSRSVGAAQPALTQHPMATASAVPGSRVESADIDGDGRTDHISSRWLIRIFRNTYSRGTLLVTVRFASGRTNRVTVPVTDWVNWARPDRPTLPFTAAAQLDGVPGEELVITTNDTPASFDRFAVVTYHGGHLTRLPAPPGHSWWVGGTVGTGSNTYDCPGTGLIAIDSSPLYRHHRPIATYRNVHIRYTWSGDHWIQSARTVSRGEEASSEWVCQSLMSWRVR